MSNKLFPDVLVVCMWFSIIIVEKPFRQPNMATKSGHQDTVNRRLYI